MYFFYLLKYFSTISFSVFLLFASPHYIYFLGYTTLHCYFSISWSICLFIALSSKTSFTGVEVNIFDCYFCDTFSFYFSFIGRRHKHQSYSRLVYWDHIVASWRLTWFWHCIFCRGRFFYSHLGKRNEIFVLELVQITGKYTCSK